MSRKWFIIALVMLTFGLSPLFSQVEPGDADGETAEDVISEHEETSEAEELFADDFENALDGSDNVAFFVPSDDALEDIDADEVTSEESEELFNAHISYGIASEEPLELVEWFATGDQSEVDVETDDDDIYLEDEIAVEDAVPAENGIVYVIDEPLE
ncbi:MAG: fasciclin domain-containing protein [Spirochaetales bacterium]